MPLYPQGLFTFPGIVAPMSGRYLCSHGYDPGRLVIKAAYQDIAVRETGDVTIHYGGESFPVRDCKVVEDIDYYDADSGHVTDYLLLDRRWRWKFSEIEGNYNRKLNSGALDRDCERTPHQLAKLLLEAMKETRFDYSALPNDPRPEVLWIGANPALELQKLARDLGCSLVYDPLTDTVLIKTTGVGASLPDIGSVDQFGANFSRPVTPSGVRLVGDVTRVQQALPMTPLQLDLEGELKDPRDVSYVANLASDTGEIEETWFYKEGLDFANISDEKQRKLCQKTMWRYWKLGDVRSQILQYFQVPKLRIEDVSLELNEGYTDEDGTFTKRGYVVGIFNLDNDNDDLFGQGPGRSDNSSTERKDVIYEGGLQVVNNHDFPYVILSRPVWKWTGDGEKRIPDQLWLVCTFAIRNATQDQTCSLHHYSYLHRIDSDSAVGPEIYHDNGFELRATLEFDKDTLEYGTEVFDNRNSDELDSFARAITQSRANRYQDIIAGNAVYKEFIKISLDGAIRSVVWSFSKQGAMTEVYRNSEPDFVDTKFDRRLQIDEIKRRAGVP